MGKEPKVTLQLDKISLKYKYFTLDKVSFFLESGDIIGITGQSGSGKSTILKSIIGQKKFSAGKMTTKVGKEEVPLLSVCSYSPQENSLFSKLTLKENLETFADLGGFIKADIWPEVEIMVEHLGLTPALDKQIVTLSGGMKKRADLAIALMYQPRILILDEPFAGLDIALRKFLWKAIKEYADKGNIVILTSHLVADLAKNSTKVGLLYKDKYYNDTDIRKKVKLKDFDKYTERLFQGDIL
jgi:ABC-2 type transport system ATP-binding protein